MWLRLAMLYYTPFFGEYPEDIFPCLYKILEYEPNNIYANIILAYLNHMVYGEIPSEVLQQINNIESNNYKDLALLEYIKGMYYLERENYLQYEKCLNNAIFYDASLVGPYVDLGRYYLKQKKIEIGEHYIKKGLGNIVQRESEKYSDFDLTNYEAFLNEFIRRTHLPSGGYEFIEKDLKKADSRD